MVTDHALWSRLSAFAAKKIIKFPGIGLCRLNAGNRPKIGRFATSVCAQDVDRDVRFSAGNGGGAHLEILVTAQAINSRALASARKLVKFDGLMLVGSLCDCVILVGSRCDFLTVAGSRRDFVMLVSDSGELAL